METTSENKQSKYTHEAGGVVGVGSDLSIDLDNALHDNVGNLALVQRKLQAITEQNDEGKRLAQLVGSGRRAGSKGAGKLVQHPGLWCGKALKMLARTTNLEKIKMRVGWMEGEPSGAIYTILYDR